MILVKTISGLQNALAHHRSGNQTIGFVPTMGALHAGHISLIETSLAQTDLTVCSIFVNPTQFNNPVDFEKYPITIERDIDMLEKACCHILFLPTAAEMYPPGEPTVHYELGFLETIFEGEYRPGHFQGVCRIVDKLLMAVQPTTLFLGQKDYQQCMVIAKMMELQSHTANLQVCATVREADGLAMSSRNVRLSETKRSAATGIIETLCQIKEDISEGSLQPMLDKAGKALTAKGFKPDYVAIAHAETLQPVMHWDGHTPAVALVAAYLGDVRLIDNLVLTPEKL